MSKPFSLSRKKLNLLAILAVIGVIVSIVQTVHFAEVRSGQAGFDSFCKVGAAFDCNAIDASPYAELFAGIPLSAAAAGWWLATLVFALAARSTEFAAALSPWLLGMTAVSSVFSLFYLWVMAAVLKVGCLLCLALDLVNFTAFGAVLHSWLKRDGGSKPVWQLKGPAIVTAICLFVAVVFSKGLQSGVPDASELRFRVQSVMASQPVALDTPAELPSIGSTAAPITIVKFSDFQCPSCRMGAQALHPVLRRYSDRVRFVYRNFPLDAKCNRLIQSPMHPAACELARGTVCAQAQGRFEAYYEQVFERQASLKPGSALAIAGDIGLNVAQFEQCLAAQETTDRVLRDIEEGIGLKVESTPTFFLNGRRISGAMPPQAWNLLIEETLKKTAP